MKHKSLLPLSAHQKSKTAFASKDDYDRQLRTLQKKMLDLQQAVRAKKLKVILVFEGSDAAGKGGAIKRLTEYLDPRGFQVHATRAPNPVEVNENYFARFFKVLPVEGTIAIFDRSWYGRVLVERVEGLIPKFDWKRAYDEINRIEKMWVDDGALVLKYCLDITYDEQKARFKERESNSFKKWKLTDEDRRNRAKWDRYRTAFVDMLKKTDTKHAPWTVVAADSKWSARVSIIKHLEKNLGRFINKKD